MFFFFPDPLKALEGRVSSLCKWSSCFFSIWLWHRPITVLSWSTAASQAIRGESINNGHTDGNAVLRTVALWVSGDIAVKSTYPESERKMRLGLHADEERSSQETHKSISNLSPALLDHTVPFWGWGLLFKALLFCPVTEIITGAVWVDWMKATMETWFREMAVKGKLCVCAEWSCCHSLHLSVCYKTLSSNIKLMIYFVNFISQGAESQWMGKY